MKKSTVFVVLMLSMPILYGQAQLEVVGKPNSSDTVAIIKVVKKEGFADTIIGLRVESLVLDTTAFWITYSGIAGDFFGGSYGIRSQSISGYGLYAHSHVNHGIYANSNFAYGIYSVGDRSGIYTKGRYKYGIDAYCEEGPGGHFTGDSIAIELGASNWFFGNDDGVIATQRDSLSSDLFLVSNDAVVVQLDNDGNEEGHFAVQKSDKSWVVLVDENGNLDAKGTIDAVDIQCSGMSICSDRRYKSNIQRIQQVSDKIARLDGVTYRWRTEKINGRRFPENSQIGLIAQEVEKVFPMLVDTDEFGYKSVNYIGLIPLLLEGHKEQEQRITDLQHQLDRYADLEARLAKIEKDD